MLKIYKLCNLVLLTLFVSTGVALAQIEVTGTVTDDLGDPLPGAAVLVKGTSNGTVTDLDGNFTVSVANQQSTLVFSFLGFANVEEVVGTRNTIDVILEQGLSGLDEVVVTGYGSQSRREITGAVTSIDSDKLLAIPATTFA